MSEKKTKARRGTPGRKVPKAKRARAAAAVLVEGMSLRQAAEAAGTSRSTVQRAIDEVQSDEDLGRYVTEYRARMVPTWVSIVEDATRQVRATLEEAGPRDASIVAKTFAELSQRAVGEPDQIHRHEVAPDLSGLSDSDLEKLEAILAGAKEDSNS